MAEADIPVDLFNPGQVFACIGLMEAADILLGDAEGGFDWSDEANPRFRLRADGDENPVEKVLRFLGKAEVVVLSPEESGLSTDKWDVASIGPDPKDRAARTYPFPEPSSPATLVAVLCDTDDPRRTIVIDHWGDATRRDNVKFWAGSGGYPGAALLRDALDLVRDNLADAIDNPFALSAPQSSSFRFDWRRDYIPLDAGFSPNEHGSTLIMTGFPLVEILAAIGLGAARPERLDKLNYRYGVTGGEPGRPFYPPELLRAVLGAAPLPFPRRVFHMRLNWPGQENQARCITDVREEPLS